MVYLQSLCLKIEITIFIKTKVRGLVFINKLLDKIKKYKNKKDQASQMKMNQETQDVYAKYGISPFGGCLPLLITMPILFALYNVIRNIPYYVNGIGSMKENPEAYKFLGLLVNESPMSLFRDRANYPYAGILVFLIPILAMVLQFINTKLIQVKTDAGEQDQMQSSMKMMNYMMPVMSGFFCLSFDVSIGIYWIIGSLFRIALDLYELEQKGVLEDEFQSYKNTTDIWKIQDAIGENGTITEERLEEYNLLFLDVSQIYREQNIYGDFLVPLAEEAEKINGKETECFKTYQHKIKKWEKELRNLFAEEISSAIITPGTGQVLDILVKLEWMAMEYAVLSQALFLQQRKGELTDKKIQKSVCVVFRMMGYADDDIWEYMENCFDSVIWPWEYYSLLV